jgi:hypothetical protein
VFIALHLLVPEPREVRWLDRNFEDLDSEVHDASEMKPPKVEESEMPISVTHIDATQAAAVVVAPTD